MHRLPCFLAALLIGALSTHAPAAAPDGVRTPLVDLAGAGVFVLDGRFVHTAGELQLHITNWGLIGSQPGLNSPYSAAPSAMWPAGSGIDYLFAAGLWIGARKDGVPLVSTGQYDYELMPSNDTHDTIYEMERNEEGGVRYPYGDGDDDGDGVEDEDPKDGLDNDGDGLIDEDFAAISNQSFRLRMIDNNPLATELWDEHDPLGVEIVQQTFQWDTRELEDSVAFEFTIRNIGNHDLEDMAIGLFADPDVGPRDGLRPGQDDLVGFANGSGSDAEGLPLSFRYMYAEDCPGVDGDVPGVIAFVFLNSNEPPTPRGIRSFHWFTANVPFERGGEPTSDLERYTLMTDPGIQTDPPDCASANDYRTLMSFMPRQGRRFRPGDAFKVQMAIVAGEDQIDLRQNIAAVLSAFYGRWFDKDGDPETGVLGRETKLCPPEDWNPREGPNPLIGTPLDCGDPELEECDRPLYQARLVGRNDLDEEGCVWVNNDCDFEFARGRGVCSCFGRLYDWTNPDIDRPCTGKRGSEHNVRWLIDAPPDSPKFRTWQTNDRVHIFWGDEVEVMVDQSLGIPNFEGYRIWRADNWTRPAGTSTATGPNSRLWKLIDEYDLVDNYERIRGPIRETLPLGHNTGLDVIRYTPHVLRPGSDQALRFAPLRALVERIVFDDPLIDRDGRIRFRDESGSISPLGEAYPELSAWECCPDVTDTLMWNALGANWYEYVDRDVRNGFYYFHALTTTSIAYSHLEDGIFATGYGITNSPHANFEFTVPQSPAQSPDERQQNGHNVYVVPNPATRKALAEFSQLDPNAQDPTGVRVEWRNLPSAENRVRVFTLSGDLVIDLRHDGRGGSGSLSWNLVTRNGQEIVSGIYLYSIVSSDPAFDRIIGRFVVIR